MNKYLPLLNNIEKIEDDDVFSSGSFLHPSTKIRFMKGIGNNDEVCCSFMKNLELFYSITISGVDRNRDLKMKSF